MTVLTFLDYYTPGFKAGGPINAIRNVAEALADCVAFRIVTRDRDLGDTAPYEGTTTSCWQPVGAAEVFYARPADLKWRALRTLICRTPHDAIYLNSFFSVLTVRVLALRRLGLIPQVPLLLAPRGELAASALQLKARRKRGWLAFVRRCGLVRNVVWHASSPHEERQISRMWSSSARSIVLAPELPTMPRNHGVSRTSLAPAPKRPGVLDAAFVARIARVKNIDGALHALARTRNGRVSLDIYGPVEDAAYWRECEKIIETMPEHVTVQYRGPIAPDRLPEVLAGRHVYILPSLGENFGHSIVEALSAGCPVLISDQTPWNDVEHRGAGWVTPLDNQERWIDLLDELIAMDEERHALLRTGAFAYAMSVAKDPHAEWQNRGLFSSLAGRPNQPESLAGRAADADEVRNG